MKNNDTGEFELVLGNRQLLSAFFVVVILFGVFFTMGYIVGRNSAPSAKAAAAETAPVPNPPATQAEAAAPTAAAPQTASTEAPADSTASGADNTPAESSPQPSTQAVREPETKAAESSAAPAAPASAEPQPGQTYLQVMAVKRIDAEVVARTLKEKGFNTTLAPARDDLVRVLVGPYADTASLGKAKAELENAGFHPIVRK